MAVLEGGRRCRSLKDCALRMIFSQGVAGFSPFHFPVIGVFY
jgi:hypothetical protein